ncbi:glycosyltransferase WbuB [Aliagarivorans taiwanensis]|uniref:glycosyltransferase WbuB n=1 Tax=Aliagarivorans taiwanensis TaxID=561966 RepID=UPI0003F5A572|nr:glycosyltransferase WbuB [Aliagarivorans taiwanensis]
MNIVLYGINYAPELTGIGKYSGEMACKLVALNHHVNVVTAPPYYPEWQIHKGFKNRWSTNVADGVVIKRAPLYVPRSPSTLKRLLHLASFAISSLVPLFSLLRSKPDVVVSVQPTLFCAPAALLFAKLTGAKSVMHIQDFEVDAMFGLGMASHGLLARLAKGYEAWLIKRFDCVSSISYSMLDNAAAKGVAKQRLLFFPNWADTDFVTPEVCGKAKRKEWGFNEADKLVLYSGNIGQKQGLEVVLDAAEALAGHSEVKFVIIGSGAYRNTLEQLADERGLSNLQFMPLQPWEDVPQILAMADVHLVVQRKGAADAVLPSKLTNILSAGGHALVTAEADTELGKIATKYPGIYTCVEPENTDAFIKGLKQVLATDTTSTNTIAREYAVENLNKAKVIARFADDLSALVKNDVTEYSYDQ